jgi:hypothetical protein
MQPATGEQPIEAPPADVERRRDQIPEPEEERLGHLKGHLCLVGPSQERR